MIKLTLAFLALITLTGCGGYEMYDWNIYRKPYKPQGYIDTEMQKYVSTFQKEGAARGVGTAYSDLVSISWQDGGINGDTSLYGLCEIYTEPEGNKVSTITLNTALRDLPASVMNLVITHELAHCLLGVGHTSHSSDDLAIMFWSCSDDQIFNANNYANPKIWSKYLDFLFKQQNSETFQ